MAGKSSGKSSKKGEGANPPPIGDWLRRALSVRKGIGKEVATALGVETSAVSRLRSNKRRVQALEVPIIERISGERAPQLVVGSVHPNATLASGNNGGPLGSELAVTLVRVLVVIAPSVWRDLGVSVAVTEQVSRVADPRLVGMRQYACKIEGEDRYAVCVQYSEMRVRPLGGDIVHVRRTDRQGRYEDTLRTVRILPSGRVQLRLEGTKHRADVGALIEYPTKNDGAEPAVEIRGLVVGFFTATNF